MTPQHNLRLSVLMHGLMHALVLVAGAICLGIALHSDFGSLRFSVSALCMAGVWLLGVAIRPVRISRSDFQVRALLPHILAALVLLCVTVVGALVVPLLPWLESRVVALVSQLVGSSVWTLALIAAVGGIAEELYFRGALFDAFPRSAAILGSTVTYVAVVSASGMLVLMLAAAVLGLLAAFLRGRFDNVVGCAVFHVAWSVPVLLIVPHLLPA
ncbi:CPBP family glutamic-type intramembrane protease [Corynebacterium pseudopelargi]|uniref:CAAX amino terminal protease self-immunity n=1 Tax=Corynebacterium pseudopelargi TaxID=2080757 RepID=A0A3G6IXB2_9CORY|nr:CPBP family glutamic-type intramembrane protease [Corynebacterium pseudopelargi]AZA08770.1 CAAX amino terminal protease self- immunity [Corynebacterium pseudopelargi]